MAWPLFFTRCDVFCDLLQYTHTEKCYLFVLYNKNSNGLLKDFGGGMRKEKEVRWRDMAWIWRHLCVCPLIDHSFPANAWALGWTCTYLSLEVRRYSSHVIMNSWQDRNWFTGDVNTSKDHRSFRYSRKTGRQQVSWKMGQLQKDMVLLWSNTPGIRNIWTLKYKQVLWTLQQRNPKEKRETIYTKEKREGYLRPCHTRQFVLATCNAIFAEKNIAGCS